MLLTRLSVDGARLFATTNPDAPTHWLKRSYLDRPAVWIRGDGETILGDAEALDLARFTFRLADNETLPDCLRRRAHAASSPASGTSASSSASGWPPRAPSTRCSMQRPAARTSSVELPLLEFHHLAIDYGTTNPFHALIVAVGPDERLYVAREWRYDHRAAPPQADRRRVLVPAVGLGGERRRRPLRRHRAAARRGPRPVRRLLPRAAARRRLGLGDRRRQRRARRHPRRSPACSPPVGSRSTSPARSSCASSRATSGTRRRRSAARMRR